MGRTVRCNAHAVTMLACSSVQPQAHPSRPCQWQSASTRSAALHSRPRPLIAQRPHANLSASAAWTNALMRLMRAWLSTIALQCPCSDNACMLKCAASSPSIKALPVAKCVNTQCGSALKAKAIDCAKATCQSQCECSLDKCADAIDACLAVDNCAASQDCALQCPCSDNACMLKCAASSPSIKALPVAKCVNTQCGSASVAV